MDMSQRVLGVFLGEKGPLNQAEFHLFVNDPAWEKYLRIVEYDPNTKRQVTLPLSEAYVAKSSKSEYKMGQTLEYSKGRLLCAATPEE